MTLQPSVQEAVEEHLKHHKPYKTWSNLLCGAQRCLKNRYSKLAVFFICVDLRNKRKIIYLRTKAEGGPGWALKHG